MKLKTKLAKAVNYNAALVNEVIEAITHPNITNDEEAEELRHILAKLYGTTVHIHWHGFGAQRYAREHANRLFRQAEESTSTIQLPRILAKYAMPDGTRWNPREAIGRIVGVWGPELVYDPTPSFLNFCRTALCIDPNLDPSIPMNRLDKAIQWDKMPDWVICVVDYKPKYGISFFGSRDSIILMDE